MEAGAQTSSEVVDVASTLQTFEEFKRATPFEDGLYVVEGDIAMGEESLRRYYGEQIVNASALTLRRWGRPVFDGPMITGDSRWSNADKRNLTFCISKSFDQMFPQPNGAKTTYAWMQDSVLKATASWENVADVRFVYRTEQDGNCTSANANVQFAIVPAKNLDSANAKAFFPHQPKGEHTIQVEYDAARNATPKTLTGVMRHELGHVLGFSHEHVRNPGATGTCLESEYLRRDLTDYDTMSVMHYLTSSECPGRAKNTDYVLSRLDEEGAMAVYDAPTNVVSDSSWTYMRHPGTGDFYRLASRVTGAWTRISEGARQFVGVNDGIFSLRQDGQAVQFLSKNTSSWVTVGGPAGQIFACGANLLCATQPGSGNLYRFDPDTQAWTFIDGPAKEWAWTLSSNPKAPNMFSMGNDLGMVQQKVGGVTTAQNIFADDLISNPCTAVLYALASTGSYAVWNAKTEPVGGHAAQFVAGSLGLYVLTRDKGSVMHWEGKRDTWTVIGTPASRLYILGGQYTLAATSPTDELWTYAPQSGWTFVGRPH